VQVTDYDVVIVGAGSGGVSLASTLVAAGRRVAVVATGLVGGECPYVACMPSKSLLRSARARTEARSLLEHGGAGGPVDVGNDDDAWKQALRRRDDVANHRDDQKLASALEERGVDVVRGFGVLVGVGRVEVAERELRGREVVVDTG
jgi:dihydrolipoamide dehydrogenase